MIGRLKRIEGRLAVAFPGRNWPKRILEAVERYNDTENPRTGLSPNEVTRENANAVFARLYKPFARGLRAGKILPVGTRVRLVQHNRGTFTKTNAPRNTRQVFAVGRIRLHPRAGVKYKLFTLESRVPIAGTYERSELIPIRAPQIGENGGLG